MGGESGQIFVSWCLFSNGLLEISRGSGRVGLWICRRGEAMVSYASVCFFFLSNREEQYIQEERNAHGVAFACDYCLTILFGLKAMAPGVPSVSFSGKALVFSS